MFICYSSRLSLFGIWRRLKILRRQWLFLKGSDWGLEP
jgi:hypothetical protein